MSEAEAMWRPQPASPLAYQKGMKETLTVFEPLLIWGSLPYGHPLPGAQGGTEPVHSY